MLFYTIIALLVVIAGATFFYMRQTKFGASPSGERLENLSKSPNYNGKKFENQIFTPDLTEGYSMGGILYEQLFKSHPRQKPESPIPSTKTDLKSLNPDENILVWFGHSSYFMQLEGKRILVDPVFSGNASPIPGTVKAFEGTDQYTVDDLPEIDVLMISHDHYDHLDYATIKQLINKTNLVVCGLGVGAHFEKWGFSPPQIQEQDWYQSLELDSSLTIHTLPARHFSGRGLKRMNTLWASYVLESPSLKIYVGGDSGYGTHFTEIGEKFGPIDLAMLDNGQYNNAWKEIHMHPEDGRKAASDLKAKRLFPVHSSKFVLAMHPWDEPLRRMSTLAEEDPIPLVTPRIGELVELDNPDQTFTKWWEEIE